MRNVIIQNMTTVDGYFEGPNREIDWHVVDGDFNHFAEEVLASVDTLLFGRVTYQLMAEYWPKPEVIRGDPVIAGWMNRLPKVVFSKTLKSVEWENSRLASADPAAEVATLKGQPGKDMMIFGSSDLSVTLAEQGLIDEYRMMVNPLFLGGGKTMLHGLHKPLKLKLTGTRAFGTGVVMLTYRPDKLA